MREKLTFGLLLVSGAFIGACSGGQFASGSPDDSGGNVGFGGAQDIGQFRALLEAGEIPGPQTLDANGFFSEHRTELPAPDCGQLLCTSGMLAVGRDWRTDDYQATLQIALTTPINPSELERKPLNMVVVVDTSGSMSVENRIGFVKDGLHLLIDELQVGDRLALVSYAGRANSVLSLSEAADATALHDAVENLVADGSTNIYDGLELGLSEALANLDYERQNRVILLSDGLATAGIVEDGEIVKMASGYLTEGIGLTTIGVGLDFNVELMRSLSERGAGNFYFIEDSNAVTEVFTEELDYFVTPLALSVSIQLDMASGYQLGDVAGTRLWKTQGERGEMLLPAVFVASRVDDSNPNGRRGGGSALFIDVVPDGGTTSPGPVGTITLSYLPPGAAERIEQTIVVENPMAPGELGEDDLYVSFEAMAEHYAVYNMFLGLRSATIHAENTNYNCAIATLNKVRVDAASWNSFYEDSDIGADIELLDQFRDNLVARGASSDAAMSGCEQLPPQDDADDWGDDGIGTGALYCQASGGGIGHGSIAVVLGLMVAFARRRRRQR